MEGKFVFNQAATPRRSHRQVLVMLQLYLLQVKLQLRREVHRSIVTRSLPALSITHGDASVAEIDVFDSRA